jgi:hypothetical protein
MKLDELPTEGKCVVAHPANHAEAKRYADYQGLDYFITSTCDEKHMYMVNLDALEMGWDASYLNLGWDAPTVKPPWL